MIFGQEALELLGVSRYAAPIDKAVNPATIQRDIERVEVITSGKVLFEGKYYGKGAIFRHLEGDSTIHISAPGKPYRCLSLRFALRANSMRRDYPRLTFWQEKRGLDEFVSDCVEGFHTPGAFLATLGAYIYSTLNWHSARSAALSQKGNIPKVVKKAMEYLDSHTETWIPVETLSKMSGLSKPYFQSLFKKHTNTTPHQYHLSKRIGQARKELVFGELTVRRISEDCGFDNLESFYRAFRKMTGLTPAQYRRRHSAAFWTKT